MLLASAKTTFFAGAALKTRDDADGRRRGARLRRDRGDEGELSHASRRSAGRSSRCSNGAALGGGWEVALIGHARFALDDPKIQLRHARGDARADPRRDRHHQDGAPARPDGGAAVPDRRQAVRSARGGRARLGRGARRRAPTSCARGARLDRRPSRRRAALGRARLPHARRHAVEPEDRRRRSRSRRRCCCRRRAASIRRPRRSSRRWSKARWSTTTPRRGSRAGSSPRSWSAQTAKNMIQAFFFDLNAIKSGKSRPAGLRGVEAAQGRRPRRRDDGRGHRPRQRGARHRRAC